MQNSLLNLIFHKHAKNSGNRYFALLQLEVYVQQYNIGRSLDS